MKINQKLLYKLQKARLYKFYDEKISAEACSRSTVYRHIRSRESGNQVERKKLAISSKGISQIHIRPSGMPINQEVYQNECIIKRLVPFIIKYDQEE